MEFQIRMVESFEAEARRGRPGCWMWYGSQAILLIHFEWPLRGLGCISWPVLGFHRRTVESWLPVAIVEASGDQLTARTQLVWPLRV